MARVRYVAALVQQGLLCSSFPSVLTVGVVTETGMDDDCHTSWVGSPIDAFSCALFSTKQECCRLYALWSIGWYQNCGHCHRPALLELGMNTRELFKSSPCIIPRIPRCVFVGTSRYVLKRLISSSQLTPASLNLHVLLSSNPTLFGQSPNSSRNSTTTLVVTLLQKRPRVSLLNLSSDVLAT